MSSKKHKHKQKRFLKKVDKAEIEKKQQKAYFLMALEVTIFFMTANLGPFLALPISLIERKKIEVVPPNGCLNSLAYSGAISML